MKRILIAAAGLMLLAGCSVNSTFVYKPGGPVAGVRTLPVKVAVVAFADGTEDFESRGSILDPDNLKYNLAKAGWGGVITALTPELWGKAFSDDLAASGRFRAVRFVYNPSELADEDLRIEGTVEKATLAGAFGQPNDFALALHALRKGDGRRVWEKRVSRTWINRPTLYDGCGGMSIQCMVDRHKENANQVMRELFAEAGAELAGALGSRQDGPAGADAFSPAPPQAPNQGPSPPESTDAEIERILKGN